MTANQIARRILHLSAADVVALMRRKIPWARAADRSRATSELADKTRNARRAIALQKAVEQIREGATIDDVLRQPSDLKLDEHFVVTAYVASWLRGEPKVTSLLDIGGGINTRFLCGVLVDHCDTVWLCTSQRPKIIEITTPVIVRTSSPEDAFSDSRKFSLVTSLAGGLLGDVSAGASGESVGDPQLSRPGYELRNRVDRLAGLVADGGSLLVTERLEDLRSETPPRNADDQKDAIQRQHFEPTVELLESRGFSVDNEAIGIDDSNGSRPDSFADAPGRYNAPTRMVGFVTARSPG